MSASNLTLKPSPKQPSEALKSDQNVLTKMALK